MALRKSVIAVLKEVLSDCDKVELHSARVGMAVFAKCFQTFCLSSVCTSLERSKAPTTSTRAPTKPAAMAKGGNHTTALPSAAVPRAEMPPTTAPKIPPLPPAIPRNVNIVSIEPTVGGLLYKQLMSASDPCKKLETKRTPSSVDSALTGSARLDWTDDIIE